MSPCSSSAHVSTGCLLLAPSSEAPRAAVAMSAEQVVDAGSPFAEYLSSIGENVHNNSTPTSTTRRRRLFSSKTFPLAEIVNSATRDSATTFTLPPGGSSSNGKRKPTVLRRGTKEELRPLVLGDEKAMRRSRFRLLFTEPLRKRLGHKENSHFLECFRYILVTSQLLSDAVCVSSTYRSPATAPPPPPPPHTPPSRTFGDKFHLNGTGIVPGGVRFWVGSGGCVVVVAVLLSWFLRSDTCRGGSRYKAVISLMLVSIVLLFFHAHTWRKRMRTTRQIAVDSAVDFIDSNRAFDMTTARTIGIIQEVEFLSKGFSIPGFNIRYATPDKQPAAHHGKRWQMTAAERSCEMLRRQVQATLESGLALHTQSVGRLSKMCNRSDLQKYFDIYDLNCDPDTPERQPDETPGCGDSVESPATDKAYSVWDLKLQLRQFHDTRRKLLCCLLATNALGDSTDCDKWNTVVHELRTLSIVAKAGTNTLDALLDGDKGVQELVQSYTRRQQKTAEDATMEGMERSSRNQHSICSTSPTLRQQSPNKWGPYMQAVANMSAMVRNIDAKMYTLRADSARLDKLDQRRRGAANGGSGIDEMLMMTPTPNNNALLRRANTVTDAILSSSGGSTAAEVQTSEEVLRQYTALGADIQNLLQEWKSGKTKFLDTISSSLRTNAEYEHLQRHSFHRAASPSPRLSSVSSASPSPSSSPSISSPDSLVSGSTFDNGSNASTPVWGAAAGVTPHCVLYDTDDYENDEDDEGYIVRGEKAYTNVAPTDDDDDNYDGMVTNKLLLEAAARGVPVSREAKSKMVESIAAMLVRHQHHTLASDRD
ncbi:Mysoin-binding motif of peroxisomes-domain-containing protein [Limtongia smithiae]|uniref:Mysoin-binding motif of peroxisomes-domain-containing protein n=1 Tax=Limtongia smithiae TaxID=1125753 RepID=UPI0034CE118E